ncbi:MAG: hypothetical protein RL653_3279 [Pseudomonadota bacterium]
MLLPVGRQPLHLPQQLHAAVPQPGQQLLTDVRWTTGFGTVEVQDLLVDAAQARVLPGRFGTRTSESSAWSVSESALDAGLPLQGFSGTLGRYQREGRAFHVQRTDASPEAAVAALRLCWNGSVQASGAVLVHASAVAWNGLAVVALGPSGAGKSTFARLCVEAGATLLSDEIVTLHPDGRVAGTPFCSDLQLPGTPGPFRAGLLVLLEKGLDEALLTAGGPSLVQACLGQLFSPAEAPAARGECFERLVAFLARVETRTFRFRQHPAAGEFIRDALAALSVR